jgi:hypothetical protein
LDHDIRVEGPGFRLRPVGVSDAGDVVEIRTGDGERNKFIHPISGRVSDQEEYIREYLAREGEYYFCVERLEEKRTEGFVAIYNQDVERKAAEWGRWVLREKSLAAVESALLIYRVGFEVLGLEEMYCRTISENRAVLSFHDSTGLSRRGVMPDAVELKGVKYSVAEHFLRRAAWPDVEMRLSKLAERIAKKLTHE